MNRYLLLVDRISAWSGKAFSWAVVILALVVCYDVTARYIFNRPTQWGFDAAYILYGSAFMMAGAYTLSRNGHVRADLVYRTLTPRWQAALDLVLYFLFFVPGVAALAYAGIEFSSASFAIREASSVTSAGTPIYLFKSVIPVAGALLLLQGVAEIARCIVCMRSGQWPARLHDVEEEDIDQLKEILSGKSGSGS
jgi:TRAP-type mannitol/chloroaromatic compound transport system permease small subunit